MSNDKTLPDHAELSSRLEAQRRWLFEVASVLEPDVILVPEGASG